MTERDAITDPETPRLTFWGAWCARATMRRALKVSAIVGTALVAVNQGDLLLAGKLPSLWKIPITYLVPYVVSSWSASAAMLDAARKSAR